MSNELQGTETHTSFEEDGDELDTGDIDSNVPMKGSDFKD